MISRRNAPLHKFNRITRYRDGRAIETHIETRLHVQGRVNVTGCRYLLIRYIDITFLKDIDRARLSSPIEREI